MSKTEVQIEVQSLENDKATFRIGRNGNLLIGFEITKEQMLNMLEHLVTKVATGKSGCSILTFGDNAKEQE